MDIILFGIQGSGKGTQGKFIVERYKLAPFETGEQLRKLAAEDSDLGRKVKAITEKGHLVPNEIVMEIIEKFMKELPKGKNVLFDGIPRKLEQAETFDALMKKLNRDYVGVYFTLTREEAFRRLITRKMCKDCKTIYPAFYTKPKCEKCDGELITRRDDNPESINTRLDVFYNETEPVIARCKSQNKIIEINGEQLIEAVKNDTFKSLDPHFPNR